MPGPPFQTPPHIAASGDPRRIVMMMVGSGLALAALATGLIVYGAGDPETLETETAVASDGGPLGADGSERAGGGSGLAALEVRAGVGGGTVRVDGDSVGTTPTWSGPVPAGGRWVRVLTQDGRVLADTVVRVRPDRRSVLDVTGSSDGPLASASLDPGPSGTVYVTSSPSGATVVLDGRSVGTAPLSVEGVRPGTRTLTVSRRGYETVTQRIEVRPGRDLAATVGLRPAEAPVAAAQAPRRPAEAARPPPPPPPRPSPPPSARAGGVIEVLVRPWGRIVIDGVVYAEATDVAYRAEVPPGTHEVFVSNPGFGSAVRTVTVNSGARVRVEIDLTSDDG